jgi:hypothetical protein
MAQPPLADIGRTGELIARVVRRYSTSALLIGFSQGMAAAIPGCVGIRTWSAAWSG